MTFFSFQRYGYVTCLMIVVSFFAGCSRSQDQIEFERQAFQIPDNYTETDPNGNILRQDDRQWNIAPMFQGFIEIFTPAYPNPTQNELVRIELLVTGSGVIDGLRADAYYDMLDYRTRRNLYDHNRAPLEIGILDFDIDPADFDRNRIYANARQVNNGLHRLFIYDRNGNMITYGDIKLE